MQAAERAGLHLAGNAPVDRQLRTRDNEVDAVCADQRTVEVGSAGLGFLKPARSVGARLGWVPADAPSPWRRVRDRWCADGLSRRELDAPLIGRRLARSGFRLATATNSGVVGAEDWSGPHQVAKSRLKEAATHGLLRGPRMRFNQAPRMLMGIHSVAAARVGERSSAYAFRASRTAVTRRKALQRPVRHESPQGECVRVSRGVTLAISERT